MRSTGLEKLGDEEVKGGEERPLPKQVHLQCTCLMADKSSLLGEEHGKNFLHEGRLHHDSKVLGKSAREKVKWLAKGFSEKKEGKGWNLV